MDAIVCEAMENVDWGRQNISQPVQAGGRILSRPTPLLRGKPALRAVERVIEDHYDA